MTNEKNEERNYENNTFCTYDYKSNEGVLKHLLKHPHYFYEHYKATYKIWFGKLFVPLHKSRESYLEIQSKFSLLVRKNLEQQETIYDFTKNIYRQLQKHRTGDIGLFTTHQLLCREKWTRKNEYIRRCLLSVFL